MDKSDYRRWALVVLLEYQLKERILGFTLMEIFVPLLVIIGIIQW
jgi:hypothetical protein